MNPFYRLYLSSYAASHVIDYNALLLEPGAAREQWLFGEGGPAEAEAFFTRSNPRLYKMARRHYFDVFVRRLDRMPDFVSGWSGVESDGYNQWRVMKGEGRVMLPPVDAGATQISLSIEVGVPLEMEGAELRVSLGGSRIAVERLEEGVQLFSYRLKPEEVKGNELVLTASRTWTVVGQDRTVQLRGLSWGPRFKRPTG